MISISLFQKDLNVQFTIVQNIKDEIISNGYSLLLVPGDLDLPDRLLIQVFKELGLVTVCLAHEDAINL